MIQNVKKIYLCNLNLKPITELNGVQTSSVSLSQNVKDYDQLTFTVDEYIQTDDGKVKSNGYDELDAFITLYLEDIGMFQMQKPKDSGDGKKNTKEITAYSLEKEWEDKDWLDFKVNTGEKDSLEQLATNNLNELGFAKEFIKFYNEKNHELSFIHLVLEKIHGWSVDKDDIDPLIRDKKIPSISQDNVNLYNLCTSTVAPRIGCLFMFDTIHRKVKVIAKESLNDTKYETNIFIGYRNLASQIDVSVDEDSIFTRYNCRGNDDLDVLDVNYQDYRIMNLDYFLRAPYMTEDLILKVKTWLKAREDNRETYIAISRQWADKKEASTEIQYRVPSDDLNIDQWDDMNQEGLEESLKYYNTLLTSLQVSVDPSWTGGDSKDYSGYEPWKKVDGSIDHDRYLQALYNAENGYGGYYTYYDTLNYIIPNIKIALENLNKPDDQKTDYIKDWETNWDLYGIEELQGKQKEYQNNLDSLSEYAKAWDDLTDEEKKKHTNSENYNNYHKQYTEAATNVTNISKALDARKAEKKVHDDKIKEINTQRNNLANQVSLENESFGFTSSDLITIHSLFHDTDYQNNNILTTSLDTTKTKIDKELELYEDAMDKLSEAAQPQYKFSVTLDNLYRIPEFEDWESQLALLNFIRLGIKDDYSVKVRVTGITYNPCEITSDLSIDFSSMITSRSGRTDLSELIDDENYRGAKNSVSLGTGNSSDEKEYMTAMLQQMMKMNLFKTTVSNIAGNTTVNFDEARVNTLIVDYMNAATIDVGKITGDEASFNKFFAKFGDFEVISADVANIKTLLAGNAGIGEIGTIHLTAKNVTIDDAVITDLIAKKISVADLATHSASADIITLIGKDNKPTIAFVESTQQFYDSNGNIRVQIGQDGNGKFNFIVRGEDGKTAMFDENGITKDGIPNNTIVNDMITDKTIAKNKLGFSVVEANKYGGVDIANIYQDGEKFGVKYSSFQEDVNNSLTELSNKITSSAPYEIRISSSNGSVFTREIRDTTLSVTLYQSGIDVTSKFEDKNFVWTRESSDGTADTTWNKKHIIGKTLQVVKDDILYGVTYECFFMPLAATQ
ncbi:hypothetical protein [Blautia obeum]|nr:hypothetical protein [Blautia obeum]